MIIFPAKSGKPSARRLSALTNIELFRRGDPFRRAPIISWGIPPQGWDGRQVYNKIRTTNKRVEREELLRAGVKCPKLWDQDGDADPKFPLLGRPDFHMAGHKFFICKNMGQILKAARLGATYFSEWFDKDRELRVHCASGKVLFVQDKNLEGVRPDQEAWTILRPSKWRIEILKESLKAVDALGLDFGAVDVLVKDKDFMICEVNTAPGLTGDFSLGKYAAYFKWLESHRFPAPKWDYNKFTKARSLRWKNRQLRPGQGVK